MRGNIEAYKIWAPGDTIWAQWVKPVMFSTTPKAYNEFNISMLEWISQVDYTTAIIVDLPGSEGVTEGLALARLGYRPVPLYNGVSGPNLSAMIVPARDILHALCMGSHVLSEMTIRPDAPPAFLLDSNRMRGFGKQPGKYDNRWCVFPQDMPSAAFLLDNGIRNVIVRTNAIQNDLAHILYRYEKLGISIFTCNRNVSKHVNVAKPSGFNSLLYRFGVILGLTRNAAGGFGGKIPDVSDRGYGMG